MLGIYSHLRDFVGPRRSILDFRLLDIVARQELAGIIVAGRQIHGPQRRAGAAGAALGAAKFQRAQWRHVGATDFREPLVVQHGAMTAALTVDAEECAWGSDSSHDVPIGSKAPVPSLHHVRSRPKADMPRND